MSSCHQEEKKNTLTRKIFHSFKTSIWKLQLFIATGLVIRHCFQAFGWESKYLHYIYIFLKLRYLESCSSNSRLESCTSSLLYNNSISCLPHQEFWFSRTLDITELEYSISIPLYQPLYIILDIQQSQNHNTNLLLQNMIIEQLRVLCMLSPFSPHFLG